MVDEAEKAPEKLFKFELLFVLILVTELETQLLNGVSIKIVEVEALVVLLEQVAV
jgi:hypothetical protein